MPAPVFKGASVVITGASSGIGRELAFALAGQGARLALAARDAARLEQTASRCRSLGSEAVFFPTDVGDGGQCAALIRGAAAAFGRLDMLVNNAGLSMWATFDSVTDLSIFETLMRVNYLGSMYCTHYALPYLKQTRGRIVAVSSLTGKTGVPTRSGYAATKHAMAGFFDSLRIELAESGVSVTVVYPGFVATEVRERAFGPDGKALKKSPMREGKLMAAETCARIILRAAAGRKREEIMTLRGKLGAWVKLISPAAVDRTAARAIARGK
jgi:short-subunit dehydrogenase